MLTRDELQKMKDIVQEVTDPGRKAGRRKAELKTAKNEQEGMKSFSSDESGQFKSKRRRL